MKKIISSLFFLILICINIHSQSEVSQLIIPKKIFVGDTAELRYNFRSSIDLFSDNTNVNELLISLDKLQINIDNNEYSIEKVILQRNGTFYTVIFTFIPWITGFIDFPKFDLLMVLFGTNNVPFEIDPLPFEVVSIISSGIDMNIRQPTPPLLIPGTIYIVYLIIFLSIVFFILIIKLILNRAKIFTAIRNHMAIRNYARNARKTLAFFKRLSKKSSKYSDVEYCQIFEKNMRNYLSIRFDYNFETVVTSKIASVFETITAGLLSEEKLDKIEVLIRLFSRADYIRFAQDSIDSKKLPHEEFSTILKDNERADLIRDVKSIIETFEKIEKKSDKLFSANTEGDKHHA